MTKIYTIVNKKAQKGSDVFSANSDKQALGIYSHATKDAQKEDYTLVCLGIFYNEMLETDDREEKYYIETKTFPYNVMKFQNEQIKEEY